MTNGGGGGGGGAANPLAPVAFPSAAFGNLVRDRSPYQTVEVAPDWQWNIEQDAEVNEWYFRHTELYVGKSLRIPVIVTNDDGEQFRDYILVGYEGAGGY